MNVLQSMRRATTACAVTLLVLGAVTVGAGADVARAIDTHPCLPGEFDYVGELEFVGGGKAFWVTF